MRLAIEFNKAYDDERLKIFANEVADSLVKYFNNHSIQPLSDSYTSASWALINLRSYGKASGRKELVDFVDQLVAKHFLVFNQPCPLDSDKQNRSFMAGCTNWAWLVSEVLEKKEFNAWINLFIPNLDLINPIQHSSSSHMCGLNFSRAWGLWRKFKEVEKRRHFFLLTMRRTSLIYPLPIKMHLSVASSDTKTRRSMMTMAGPAVSVFELTTRGARREINIFVVVKSRFNPLDLHLHA